MPAKKSGRSKVSPAIAAREVELAQEAEILRQETQKWQIRNEESELRQRIEEEERKILEAHQVRERNIRNTLAEIERNEYYTAKEKEINLKMTQKVQALQEAEAMLELKKQDNEFLEKEKASALRRVALLSNELELAQLRYTEAQRQLAENDHGYQEAQRNLEAEYDVLQQAHQELEMKCAALELEHSKTVSAAEAASAAAAASAEEAAKAKKARVPSGDEEITALLRVMQSELERYKATATQLQEEVTQVRKEEEKCNLLIGILNTQLEAVREDNRRLHDLAQKRETELEAASKLRRDAQASRQTALMDTEKTLSAAAVQQRQLELELNVHRAEVEKLTAELGDVRQECTALKKDLKCALDRAAQQAQSDHAANAAMQAELANQKKDLEIALRAKESADDEKFNHKILTRAETDSLKTRLQRLQEMMERKDREAFETIAVLKEDVSREKSTSAQVIREKDLHAKALQKNLTAAEGERDSLRSVLNALKESSLKREHELYEQLTQVTAYHTAAREELERLRTDSSEKETAYTHNAICLNAECENLKKKIAEISEASAQQRRSHTKYLGQLQTEAEQLESRLKGEIEAERSERAKECERADMAERNVSRLQERIRQMDQTAHLGNREHDEAMKALQAENADIRNELRIARRTIERLECAIGDQAGYRQLTELNDKLTRELRAYERNVVSLKDKTIALQIEAETMGGYKVRKAQEERELMSRRLQHTERRYRLLVPLFAQLRVLVETQLPSYMNPELLAALEDYDRQTSLIVSDAATSNTKETGTTSGPVATDTAVDDAAVQQKFNTTVPASMQPHRPYSSSSAHKNYPKGHVFRPSCIVTGMDAEHTAVGRLPPISNV